MISGLRYFLIAALLVPVAARADDVALTTVMHELAAVKFGSGHFSEDKTIAALTQPLHSKGLIAYSAPDHLEKNIATPEPMQLAVTGNELTVIRNGTTHKVDLSDHPEIEMFVESVRATLTGNLAGLKRYYTVDFTGSADAWDLLLQPNDSDMQQIVKSIRIKGTHGLLTGVDTVQTNGDHSEMTIMPVTP